MLKEPFILLWTFQFCVVLIGGQSEGEQCSTSISQPGICRSLAECPLILDDIKKRIRNHVICEYKGFSQIVCCPTVLSTATATRQPITSSRISVKKCNEYKEVAYKTVYIANVLGQPPISKKVSICGFTVVSLIVGGTAASPREFPHMALIGYTSAEGSIAWNCGASLISEQFVLSASHCYESREYGVAKFVRLGEHDLDRTDDGSAIDLNIIEIFRHPEYKYPSHYNDIGLFKFERKVEFDKAIRPACLPEQSDVPNKQVIATGWGNVAWKDDENKSNVLLKVVLDMFSQDECNSTYRSYIGRKLNKGIVEETQMCAGSKEGRKDTCQGDSGGPLQVYHQTHHCTYTVVGITSFGNPCAAAGDTNVSTSVYTRVYAYLSWIESVVWPNE